MQHPHLKKLDQIAGQMNGWLLMITFGLLALVGAVLIAKTFPEPTVPIHHDVLAPTAPAATAE